MFRVVVQDSRRTPTSGRVVALLGSYDPHAKTAVLAKDKAAFYLGNGAQPSDRVVSLFEKEGVKLPTWVQKKTAKQGSIRKPEKLRKNQPQETKTEAASSSEASEQPAEAAPAAEVEGSSESEE
jgi:small subunit ribosomal protein S16